MPIRTKLDLLKAVFHKLGGEAMVNLFMAEALPNLRLSETCMEPISESEYQQGLEAIEREAPAFARFLMVYKPSQE